jgi:hypothetical protein
LSLSATPRLRWRRRRRRRRRGYSKQRSEQGEEEWVNKGRRSG